MCSGQQDFPRTWPHKRVGKYVVNSLKITILADLWALTESFSGGYRQNIVPEVAKCVPNFKGKGWYFKLALAQFYCKDLSYWRGLTSWASFQRKKFSYSVVRLLAQLFAIYQSLEKCNFLCLSGFCLSSSSTTYNEKNKGNLFGCEGVLTDSCCS